MWLGVCMCVCGRSVREGSLQRAGVNYKKELPISHRKHCVAATGEGSYGDTLMEVAAVFMSIYYI